ncbi:uncharacterized protein RHO17_002971 [Thomomys bottae]
MAVSRMGPRPRAGRAVVYSHRRGPPVVGGACGRGRCCRCRPRPLAKLPDAQPACSGLHSLPELRAGRVAVVAVVATVAIAMDPENRGFHRRLSPAAALVEEEEALDGPESSEALAADLQRLTLNSGIPPPAPGVEAPALGPSLRRERPAGPKVGLHRVILEQKRKLAHLRSVLKNRYSQIQGLLEDPTEALPGSTNKASPQMAPGNISAYGSEVHRLHRPLTEFSQSVAALFRSFVLNSQLQNSGLTRPDRLAPSQNVTLRRRRRKLAYWKPSPVSEGLCRHCNYCQANNEDPSDDPSSGGDKGPRDSYLLL